MHWKLTLSPGWMLEKYLPPLANDTRRQKHWTVQKFMGQPTSERHGKQYGEERDRASLGWRKRRRRRSRMVGRNEERNQMTSHLNWYNLLNANSQLLPMHVFNLPILKYILVQIYLISWLGEEKPTQEMLLNWICICTQKIAYWSCNTI